LSKAFFDTKIEFRANNQIVKKIEYILESDEEIEGISHLIRCAIIRMYNDIKKGDKNAGVPNKRGSGAD